MENSTQQPRKKSISDEQQTNTVKRVTWLGLYSNLLLAAVKFVAGTIGHSQAVVADAVHSLSDLISDAGILIGVKYWSLPPDENHPHGHRKFELFVTLGIGIILALVAFGLFWDAIISLKNPSSVSPSLVALLAPIFSIIVKEILYRWTAKEGKRVDSVPLLANAWHHRSDALSSIPAAIAVAGSMIEPSWVFLDSVGAIVVAVFILFAAYKIAKPVLFKLSDAGAPPEQVKLYRELVSKISGVEQINILKTRYLGCTKVSVEIHVAVDEKLTVRAGHDIAKVVRDELMEEFDEIQSVLVHIDPM